MSIVAPVLVRAPRSILMRSQPRPSPELAGTQHRRVLDLLETYSPNAHWRPFAMSLLCYSAEDRHNVARWRENAHSHDVQSAASTLCRMISSERLTPRSSLMIISDLEGPDSVIFSTSLAGIAEIVLQLENVAHSCEGVALRTTRSEERRVG